MPQDVIPSTVHCGSDASLLISSTGAILVTGSNRYNKLGMECTMSTDVPAILQMTSSFKDLSQTSMLMSSVFTKSMQKPLGVEEPKSKATRIFTKSMTFRHTDSSILQQLIKTASIGINHCGFINSNGECITSGDNSYGQVGHDNDVPSIVDGLMPVEHISCGDSYTIISTRDGEVYSWGCGKRGRLGYEYEGNQDKPTLVAFEKPQTVQMIKSDHSVTMVMATPISL
jgi:NIMA (never in mitosis gene a)-related kinase